MLKSSTLTTSTEGRGLPRYKITMDELTCALRFDSHGEEEKCSVEAVGLSMQPYASMSLQDASEGFSKLRKGISLDEDIEDEELEEEEGNLLGLTTHNVDAREVIVEGSDVTGLPKDFKLTDSQKECVDLMRKDMEKGQMLVFVHGPPGSCKITACTITFVREEFKPCIFWNYGYRFITV